MISMTIPLNAAYDLMMADMPSDTLTQGYAMTHNFYHIENSRTGHEHEWTQVSDAVAKGGGLLVSERCDHCELIQHTDTWAQDRESGKQGFTAISWSVTEVA